MIWSFLWLSHASFAVFSVSTPELDTLKRKVAALSAEGMLDAATTMVEGKHSSISSGAYDFLRGKLTANGETSRRLFEQSSKDSTLDSETLGEVYFRLGQLHYGSGKPHLAIAEFRTYLQLNPTGHWAEPASYWMAWACLDLTRRQKKKFQYLDTGLIYADQLEKQSRPKSFYLSLALYIKARLLLAKGDSATALRVLTEAESSAPPEDAPGILLMTIDILRAQAPEYARSKEDLLKSRFPNSPEIHLLSNLEIQKLGKLASLPKTKIEPSIKIDKPKNYTLQLGAFSNSNNAESLRLRLMAKGYQTRISHTSTELKPLFRVYYGVYENPDSAQAEGDRNFKSLGYIFQIVLQP